MNKERILRIIEGALIIALGILVAINGGGTVLNYYIAIVSIIVGVSLAVLDIVKLNQTGQLDFPLTFMSCALITIASAIFAHVLSLAIIIELFVFLLIAFGGALLFYGFYLLSKKSVIPAIVELVSGAIAITLGVLYLTVADFRVAFWIVTGVFIALFGAYYLLLAIIDKNIK